MIARRELIFANGNAYHIDRTIEWLQRLVEGDDDIETHVYESVVSQLTDLHYNMNPDVMLEDLYSGIVLELDEWLFRFGIVDHSVSYFLGENNDMQCDETIGTFEDRWVNGENGSSLDPVIEEEEEEDVIIGANLVADFARNGWDRRFTIDEDEECIEDCDDVSLMTQDIAFIVHEEDEFPDDFDYENLDYTDIP